MTKEEAIQEMRKGKKIRHGSFLPEEWMTMDGEQILLEDGVKCSQDEFWVWRKEQRWDDGYELWLAVTA